MFWEIIGLVGISVTATAFIFYYIEIDLRDTENYGTPLTMEEIVEVLNDY